VGLLYYGRFLLLLVNDFLARRHPLHDGLREPGLYQLLIVIIPLQHFQFLFPLNCLGVRREKVLALLERV
jgi:hypothetical protein